MNFATTLINGARRKSDNDAYPTQISHRKSNQSCSKNATFLSLFTWCWSTPPTPPGPLEIPRCARCISFMCRRRLVWCFYLVGIRVLPRLVALLLTADPRLLIPPAGPPAVAPLVVGRPLLRPRPASRRFVVVLALISSWRWLWWYACGT